MQVQNWLFLVLSVIMGVGIGCGGVGRVSVSKPETVLEPLNTYEIAGEVVDLCVDENRLLLLCSSGTRIFVVDTNFSRLETIPLAIRLIHPRGIECDRYYIYTYDDNVLYRIAKDRWTMTPVIDNIRVGGLVSYAPGEILVSEKDRQEVVFKTLFGESRIFLDRTDIPQPGAMADFPGNVLGILSGTDHLVKVNRVGIVIGRLKIPRGVDVLCADIRGRAVVMQRGEPVIWIIGGDILMSGYGLFGVTNPLKCEVMGNRIVVLDSGRRIIFYPLPGR